MPDLRRTNTACSVRHLTSAGKLITNNVHKWERPLTLSRDLLVEPVGRLRGVRGGVKHISSIDKGSQIFETKIGGLRALAA
jgi:hypothetical protein